MTDGAGSERGADGSTGTPPRPVDRVRLEALRYAVNEEAATYVGIMRLFTEGLSGLMSDLSADEVVQRLGDQGIDVEVETADDRLSYLVEHGNLARSPRETEARTLKDYLRNRSRYQLTQRGDLVQRHVEELLGHAETVREVSSEMLGGILDGLTALARYDPASLHEVEPDELAQRIGTVFAQFSQLVESTREFYTYLTRVLSRFDLDRVEFQAFKTALLDYLQRFVAEVDKHMPQVADALRTVEPMVAALCARANAGQRLVDLEGRTARRSPGLEPQDWQGIRAWFTGENGRDSDAEGVRRLATDAMRALLVNLRRIASAGDREQSRYGDLLRVARWFDQADDGTAHALAAAVFGLYPCRHLGLVGEEADQVPATTSWWTAPAAEVPVMLRTQGERRVSGRSGQRVDFTAAKAARLAERAAAERRQVACLDELVALAGSTGSTDLGRITLSDAARSVLLEHYAGSLSSGTPSEPRHIANSGVFLAVRRTPGRGTTVVSPQGALELVGTTLTLQVLRAAATGVG